MKDKLLIKNELLEKLPNLSIKLSEPLSKHTFIRTGGIGDVFVKPANIEELQIIVQYSHSNNIPLTVLGKGTNVIIKDSGIRGIIVCLEKFNNISVDGDKIYCESGASIIDVSRTALEHHLTGLEFACGIPGTVGGALIMNAGAYGGEISEVLQSARVLDRKGNILTLREGEFEFGYRTSVFGKKDYIIIDAILQLKKGDPALIKAQMDKNTYLRELKQPLEYPSCGSVFKRPPNHYAGKLIQDSGLQGTRIGGAEVSRKHAGFIVNVDNATSTDYLKLIRLIQKTVKEKFGVDLEPEVKIIGDDE